MPSLGVQYMVPLLLLRLLISPIRMVPNKDLGLQGSMVVSCLALSSLSVGPVKPLRLYEV